MCTQKPPHDYSEQLYGLYKDAFNKYINEMVRGRDRAAPGVVYRSAPRSSTQCSAAAAQSDVASSRGILQVLPSLREHRDEVLLKELYQRWQNHKLMVRWLSRFFNYLDR